MPREPLPEGRANAAYRARFDALYAQLHRLAHRELSATPRGTLCTTALVHEAFLKLDGKTLDVAEQGRFMALAAKAMRHVLIDALRGRNAGKRGGGQARITLVTDIPAPQEQLALELQDLENGLNALEAADPRLAALVECRFYGGMEFDEIARHLGVSESTVYRDWRTARAFLQSRLAG